MVATEKFENVVAELESTLAREKRAQELLNEQSTKLAEVKRQLEKVCRENSQRESELSDSVAVSDYTFDKLQMISSLCWSSGSK